MIAIRRSEQSVTISYSNGILVDISLRAFFPFRRDADHCDFPLVVWSPSEIMRPSSSPAFSAIFSVLTSMYSDWTSKISLSWTVATFSAIQEMDHINQQLLLYLNKFNRDILSHWNEISIFNPNFIFFKSSLDLW